MSGVNFRQVIEVQATVLGPVLHAGVATSLAAARTRNRGLSHQRYPYLIPSHMRAELREYLEANPLPNGWLLGGDSRRMGQLLLAQPDLNVEMRVLKERRRTYPNGVPVAGKNQARREVWADVPIDDLDFSAPPADPARFLLLWDFRRGSLDEFTLRIVHTIAPGVYGKAVPCDLILDVNDGGEIYKRLAFTGSPDDDDLFAVDVAEEENESGS